MFGQAFTNLQGVSIEQYKGAPGLLQTPSRSEYLGAHVAQGFERTSTGRVLEETDIMEAERREGTADEEYRLNEQMLLAQGVTPEDVGMSHSRAMSRESWEASSYYRKGMEYRPDMTETRARIMAENYDQRRYRDQVVAAGDASYGLLTRGLGFGAMLIGSLPDPINFVSFAGGAAKAQAAIRTAATSGAGAAARAGALAGMKAGAVEGAVGNAVVDAMVLPDLAARGEDVGFADLMLDTVFGAVIGAGLGSAGGALSGYVGAKRLARLDELTRRMAERERQLTERHALQAEEFDSLDNGYLSRFGGPEDFDSVPDAFFLPRNDDADVARAGMTGRDKRDAARAVEKALDDITAGRPVDVGPVLRESQALGRAYDTVRDNPLGGPPDEMLAVLTPEDIEQVLVHRGPAVRDGEKIVVQGHKVKQAHGTKRGYGIVKIIFGHGEKGNKNPDMPPVTRDEVVSLPNLLRDWLPVSREYKAKGDGATTWRIPRADGNHLVIVAGRGLDGADSRLVSMYVDKPDVRPSQKKTRSDSPSPSARQEKGYTADGIDVLSASAGPRGSLEANVRTGRPNVNFAVEQRENFPAAPDVTAHDEQAARDAADAATAQRLDEMEAAGTLDEDSARQLAESRDEAARAEQYDELGQSVIECIWNAGA